MNGVAWEDLTPGPFPTREGVEMRVDTRVRWYRTVNGAAWEDLTPGLFPLREGEKTGRKACAPTRGRRRRRMRRPYEGCQRMRAARGAVRWVLLTAGVVKEGQGHIV